MRACAKAEQWGGGRGALLGGADVSTARAQPFSINISDDVKPFESPRPARKPRIRTPHASTSASRKPVTALPAKIEVRPETPAAAAAAAPRTPHFALRLEPIRLGPAPAPQSADTPKNTRDEITRETAHPRWAELADRFQALTQPVTISAERKQAIIWCAVAFAVSLGVLFAALQGAVGLRQRSEARMSQMERQIEMRAHNVTVHARDVSETHAIDNTNLGTRDLDRVLADLAWTEAAKTPEARLRRWSWSADQFSADANRPDAFAGADRPVRRRAASARRGVWTFKISPSAPSRHDVATLPGRSR